MNQIVFILPRPCNGHESSYTPGAVRLGPGQMASCHMLNIDCLETGRYWSSVAKCIISICHCFRDDVISHAMAIAKSVAVESRNQRPWEGREGSGESPSALRKESWRRVSRLSVSRLGVSWAESENLASKKRKEGTTWC
jgi:hypothetical protein